MTRPGSDLTGQEAFDLATGSEPLDYAALGFMCGLEIHQQLATKKLFSPCDSDVVDPDEVAKRTTGWVRRKLRATQSELGETDAAALAEAKRRRTFQYLAIQGTTSLVELDEEPPHPLDADALDVTLQFTGLVSGHPAREVHTMRKTVIDGSNTSGFQRTALVATGGTIDPPDFDPVGVWTIAVEEDSARKVDDVDGVTTYTLDRLGIPLMEIATAPDIHDPLHAQATARRIGALLRATGRVRRGLGTIRQDLNVSVAVGDRVEIKGCQDIRAVPRVIEQEVRRQLWIHYVREELTARGFAAGDIEEPVDVGDHFAQCESKVVKGALKRGGTVMALALPKWAGLIQGASKDGPRLGREFADHAKVRAGVKGVFHSDEMPAYGITENEVEAVRTALSLTDSDAFVLCVEKATVAREALHAVADAARDALGGAGRAVRAAQPDDSTRYMRPLPGAARMYPETDVPPTRITDEHWGAILSGLPERPEETVARLTKDGISEDLALQIVSDGHVADYDAWRSQDVEGPLAARILLQYLGPLAQPDRVKAFVPDLASALSEGRFAKEAVPDILNALDADPSRSLDAAIDAAGVAAAGDDEVTAIVEKVVADRVDFVKERGMAAMGPLMGPVMAELRGKADGAKVSAALKDAIQAHLT